MSTAAGGRRLRSAAAAVLLLVCGAFVVIGLLVAWQRTLIPLELHGTVTRFAAVEVDQPGVDDWVEFHIGDTRHLTVIASLSCIGEGVEVEKDAWSRTITVNGQDCRLPAPRQAIADTVVPSTILALIVLIVPRVRTLLSRVRTRAGPDRH